MQHLSLMSCRLSFKESAARDVGARDAGESPRGSCGDTVTRAEGGAGGSTQRRMERGRGCVERNRSERAQVANVAEWKPPASTEAQYICTRTNGRGAPLRRSVHPAGITNAAEQARYVTAIRIEALTPVRGRPPPRGR
jgi:hypothetical protein